MRKNKVKDSFKPEIKSYSFDKAFSRKRSEKLKILMNICSCLIDFDFKSAKFLIQTLIKPRKQLEAKIVPDSINVDFIKVDRGRISIRGKDYPLWKDKIEPELKKNRAIKQKNVQ